MNILVRLPNWLGDMVMSVGFLHQLRDFFPDASISVIAKKGIHDLLPYFPAHQQQFIFDKENYSGLRGLYRFGRMIRSSASFDLFFSLPDSFSSAFMGHASGSKKRIGYKNELREFLLTSSYKKPVGLHRVEEYLHLLEAYTGKKAKEPKVKLLHNFQRKQHVVVNINSEASSRRLTIPKAVEILSALQKDFHGEIVLIGAPKEKSFVEQVIAELPQPNQTISVAGATSLTQLVEVLASAKLMLTTDSGPAHLANALGTPTLVLFGAGNENNTAPYNRNARTITRLGKLSCEPCQKNVCVQFSTPQCLELMETTTIIQEAKQLANYGK
jgi:lipopolysaccharide heptosyltransferase II